MYLVGTSNPPDPKPLKTLLENYKIVEFLVDLWKK